MTKTQLASPVAAAEKADFALVLREYDQVVSSNWEAESTKSFDLVNSFESDATTAYQADRSLLEAQILKNLFFTEDWVYIPVNVMASKISAQQLKVVKKINQNGKSISEPADDHPVQKKIDNPNPLHDYAAFMYVTVVDEAICGNSVTWNAQNIGQLIPIPWENIQLNINANNFRRIYGVRQANDSQAVLGNQAQLSFDQSQIIHVRRPNPSNPVIGLSPMIPATESVLFNRYTSRFLNNFYEKGATPQMALSMDKDANEKNALRLLRSFEQAYTGRKNARRTLVLPKGVTATSLSQTLADQQLIAHIDTNRETILAIWAVPKHEVSLAETGSLGSQEAKTALKNFWQASLIPIMRRIEGAMTRCLAQELGQGYVLEFDLSDVECLREDEVAKAELAKVMLATHSPNEIRAKLYDDPPIAGGDSLQAPQASAGGFGGLPNASVQANEGKAITLDAKAGEAVETTAPGQLNDQAAVAKKAATERAARLKGGAHQWFTDRQKALHDATEKQTLAMQKVALDHFSDVAIKSIKTVKEFLKTKDYQPGRTKMAHAPRSKATAAGNPKKPVDPPKDQVTLMSSEKLRKALQSAYSSLEDSWVNNSVKILVGTADVGYGLQIQVPYKIPNEAALQALRTQGDKQRRAILEDRELRTFAQMSDTTTEKIMGIVEDGVAQADTIQSIADQIASDFTDIDNINSRSLVIARTETLTAASIGQAAADQDLATVIPDLVKTWISTHDDRTRGPGSVYGWKPGQANHVDMDGEQVGIDEPFSNGLMYPRDPNGDADQVIQCRCGYTTTPKDFDL